MSRANLRWYIKKSARLGVTFGTGLSGSLLLRRRLAASPRVRVLTYHRIGEAPYDPFCVTPERFEAQMRLLADEGRAVSLQQLVEFLDGTTELPEDACLVTIDDGLLSTLTQAMPILARCKVPAVAFVSSSLVGREFPGLPERYLTWAELKDLCRSGLVAVGSHAHSHRSLGLMPLAEAREEAQRSKALLEENLGTEIMAFAYPFGTHTDFGAETDRVLAEAGYAVAFNSVHGSIRRGMSAFSLPRVKVEGGEPLAAFSMISRGGMDAWWAVDRTLWRLQRVRSEIT